MILRLSFLLLSFAGLAAGTTVIEYEEVCGTSFTYDPNSVVCTGVNHTLVATIISNEISIANTNECTGSRRRALEQEEHEEDFSMEGFVRKLFGSSSHHGRELCYWNLCQMLCSDDWVNGCDYWCDGCRRRELSGSLRGGGDSDFEHEERLLTGTGTVLNRTKTGCTACVIEFSPYLTSMAEQMRQSGEGAFVDCVESVECSECIFTATVEYS